MSTPLDDLDFDYERSRAAVAVACLQWLRCTGPAIDLGMARETRPVVAQLPRDPQLIEGPIHAHDVSPHPLWDRWLDG